MTSTGKVMAVAAVGGIMRNPEGDRFLGINAAVRRADISTKLVATEVKRGGTTLVSFRIPASMANGEPVDFKGAAEAHSEGGCWYYIKMTANDTGRGYRTMSVALDDNLQVPECSFWSTAPLEFDAVARAVAERDGDLSGGFNVLLGMQRLFGGPIELPAVIPGATPAEFVAAAEAEIEWRNRFAPRPRLSIPEIRAQRVERQVVSRIKGAVSPEVWAAIEEATGYVERRVTPRAVRYQESRPRGDDFNREEAAVEQAAVTEAGE